jgi:hypothetical protein
MSSVRLRSHIALLLVLLPLLAGCGAEGPSGPQGASVAPGSAKLFLAVDTSFDSSQWKTASDLAAKFPDSDRALKLLFDELGAKGIDFEADVKPALGPETDVVGLELSGEGEFVGLTQPKDKAKLDALLDKTGEEFVTRSIGGWTAFSDSAAVLDKFERARADGTLADSSDYQDAISEVDGEALGSLYLNGAALQEEMTKGESGLPPGVLDAFLPGGKFPSIALALKAEEGGIRLEGAAKLAGDEGGLFSEPFEADLPDEVPAGALFYMNFNGLGTQLKALRDAVATANPEFDRDLARVENELGVSLDEDVFPLFSGESAVYVRRGLIIPEVTLVTHVDDEQAAVATVGKLVQALREYVPTLGSETSVDIDGVQAKQVPLAGPVALYYGAFDGHLVITTSRDGIASLREEDDRLADDSDFKSALDEAGVPDETTGFGYLDLKAAIPALFDITGKSGNSPTENEIVDTVRRNLEPLDNLVFYGTKDGRTVRFTAFLAVH